MNTIVLQRLKEREKELNTLYKLDELLSVYDLSSADLFTRLIEFLPLGWQYSSICEIRIKFEGEEWLSEDFRETEWMQSAELVIDNSICGEIEIAYLQLIREFNGSQFFPEEQKLLNTIAERVSNYLFQQRLRNTLKVLKTGIDDNNGNSNIQILSQSSSDQHWKWRFRIAERISILMDFARFGVKSVYLIGSTKNATAGPASDIDLLIHHGASEQQLNCLKSWLEGWSLCLAEENFQRTGYQTSGLIDIHLITDADIIEKSSFAIMINAVNDPARLLRKMEPVV